MCVNDIPYDKIKVKPNNSDKKGTLDQGNLLYRIFKVYDFLSVIKRFHPQRTQIKLLLHSQ